MNRRGPAAQSRPAASAEEVHDFYERMPYPAPLASLDEHRDLYDNPDRRRVQFHLLWPTEPVRSGLDVLIAGCGTSQAARYALREPDARVTAIDVSEASLRHTRALQQRYRLTNLELHALSIENVGQLGRTFDQVVCTGVLHHLPDPDAGLCALRAVVRVQGAMHLMVYAPYGRAGIYMMQEYCRLLGIRAETGDLQTLSATLAALPAGHPLGQAMQKALDFNHSEAVADALLHPLDRAYSVPELYAWLARCGLSFGRWMEQAPYLPTCGAAAKTPHAARLASLPSPLQHAAMELFRGTMTRHKFVAYRDDRVGEAQPIAFGDDRWRDYVAVRPPWTVCVRERLPAGCAAVLINRAHTFPDLVCAVDPFEDMLLAAIDGRRTLGEIIRSVAPAGRVARARAFFERLWQYDQVVFDASRAGGPVAPSPGAGARKAPA